jgi:hypothetical protein
VPRPALVPQPCPAAARPAVRACRPGDDPVPAVRQAWRPVAAARVRRWRPAGRRDSHHGHLAVAEHAGFHSDRGQLADAENASSVGQLADIKYGPARPATSGSWPTLSTPPLDHDGGQLADAENGAAQSGMMGLFRRQGRLRWLLLSLAREGRLNFAPRNIGAFKHQIHLRNDGIVQVRTYSKTSVKEPGKLPDRN